MVDLCLLLRWRWRMVQFRIKVLRWGALGDFSSMLGLELFIWSNQSVLTSADFPWRLRGEAEGVAWKVKDVYRTDFTK